MKKMTRISGALGLAALAVATVPCAQAQDLAPDTGWYGGISAGRSAATIDDGRITSELLGAGLATSGITNQDRSSGYKIFGGYQINRVMSVEGGYFDLGKFGFTAKTVPPGTLTGDIKLHGLNLDLVGKFPITEKFSLLGRVGLNYADAQDHFAGTGAVNVTNPNPHKRDTNYKFGLGLGYDFTEALGMRLEAERYRVNDAVGHKGHVDLVTLGLVYRFGSAPPPVVSRAAPAPAPMPPAPVAVYVPPPVAATMPPPPPPPLPVVLPVVPRKVSFSADSTFSFDSAALKPEGKEALNKLASDLRGTRYDVITVTGHTDRIGPHAYNLGLSTRRANTVSAYLAEAAGIPAGKISATGVDGTDPVTKPGDCQGTKPTKALIACLQPDRRVEVEVTGTR